MDPVADKFMVIGTLLSLLFRMLNPETYGVKYQTVFVVIYFVAVLFIIFRELAITSLRLVLVNASGTVVAANMLGKIKTVCQMVCICFLFIEPLVDALICYADPTFFFAHVYPVSYLFVGLMLIFTLWSGINYVKGGWKHISTDW
jgi:phosphatidylglycerophosphate synthase